ncbi:hypothetical protein MKW92_010380, partial [Papaver armeniacum]
MEEDGESDKVTKEEKVLKLQLMSKDPTVNILNIQEHVDKYIERFQNQLIKIKRVGQLAETKDEADIGERIPSFIN